MRNDQTLRPRYAVAMLFGLLFALAFGVTPASEARAAPVVTDPNTNFHRLYIVGSGDTPAENAALADDLNALKAALEKQGNHKSLNSLSATNPSLFQLKVYINSVKNNAQPGERRDHLS